MRIVCGLDVHKDSIFLCIMRIQQLRLYDRRIYDLDDEIIRKLAKLDAAVQRCNIHLSNYVSNTDSVSYKSVIDKIYQPCQGYYLCGGDTP